LAAKFLSQIVTPFLNTHLQTEFYSTIVERYASLRLHEEYLRGRLWWCELEEAWQTHFAR